MDEYLSEAATLPADGYAGVLVGRVWLPGDPAARRWWRSGRTASSTSRRSCRR